MSILIPWCMRYNLERCKQEYSELLELLEGATFALGIDEEERAMASIASIEGMLKKMNKLSGLPLCLSEAGVKKEDFPAIIKRAINDGAVITNPKPVDENVIEDILGKAF